MIYTSNAMEEELAMTNEQRRARDQECLAWLMDKSQSAWIHTPTTGLLPGPRHPWFHVILDPS